MTAIQRRVLGHVSRRGDGFTLAGSPAKGLFTLASFGTMRIYLSLTDLETIEPPYVLCLLDSATSASAGDAVNWNGRALTVKKVVEALWGGAVAARLLVLG